MSRLTTGFRKLAMTAVHIAGIDRLFARLGRGRGAILMLHRVRPASDRTKGPNRVLEITPDFLDLTIQLVLRRGFDVLSLDNAHARIGEGDFDRPFVCFTFDDGFRDNREFAQPIFQRHGLPFALYVSSDFADGLGDLWWLKLEMAIAATDVVEMRMSGVVERLETQTQSQKDAAFERIRRWSTKMSEEQARNAIAELCRRSGVDTTTLCRDLIMDWNELREFASDPLVTIGAHTRRHLALAKLTRAEAKLEMEESIRRIERELGRPVRHFSFPYGDEESAGPREFELARELGLATAVTAREGLICETDARRTTSLPRIALNGDFQSARYVNVLLSGASFVLGKAGRRTGDAAVAA